MADCLAFQWPESAAFWCVYLWAFWPEFRLIRRARPLPSDQDAGSLRWLVISMRSAVIVAFLATVWPQGAWPQPLRGPLFALGLLLIIAGSTLRRHCRRMLGERFTAAVCVSPGQAVVERGAYAFIRHPSYTGGAVMFLGLGLALGNALGVLVLMAATIASLAYRVRVEERALLAELGAPYRSYMGRSKRFLPFLF